MTFEKGLQQDCEDIKNSVSYTGARSEKSRGKKAMADDNDNEQVEAVDHEVHHKEDCPPRFSTLFESKAPQDLPVVEYMEERRPRRASGVHFSWPTVILLGVLLLFETIALSAYTAIGLYNNMPHPLVTTGHSSVAAFDTAGHADSAPINISPNIIIGAGDHTVTETVTVFASITQTPTAATANVASAMADLASEMRGMIHSTSSPPPPIAVVTVTPGGAATSVVVVTHTTDSAGSEVARPTTFSTVFVDPSVLAAQQAANSALSTEASKRDDTTTSTTSQLTTSTASLTSTTSTTSTTQVQTSSTTTEQQAKGTNKACIGGAGAVSLVCLRSLLGLEE